MGGKLEGRAGLVVAFLLGAVIATATTAGAATLITGRQIKDGTITQKDLAKAVRDQLAKAGLPGPKGATGARGAAGPAGAPGRRAIPVTPVRRRGRRAAI